MKTCRDLELLVSARAAGALDPAGDAVLDAHLGGCERCRAELDATARALSLAALPPPSEAERRALSGLATRALAEHAQRGRRARRLLAGLAAAAVGAAAALAVVAPVLLQRSGPAADAVAAADAGWQEPDLDEMWDATDVLELE